MLAQNWRLILDGAHPASYNMACDEAIFLSVASGASVPVLRLYQWEPAAISIGYHGDARQVDREHCREMGWEFVRRPTGGGAVFHDRELTYAVAAPVRGLGSDVLSVYRQVSAGLVAALRRLGLEAQLQPPHRREEARVPEAGERGSSGESQWAGVCFDTPSAYELMVGGRKVVGSAQVRRGGYFLQHGAILIEADPHRHLWGFHIPDPDVRRQAELAFASHAAGLADILRRPLPVGELVAAVAAGMAEALDLTLVPSAITDEEAKRVDWLLAHKYLTKAWNDQGVYAEGAPAASTRIVPGDAARVS